MLFPDHFAEKAHEAAYNTFKNERLNCAQSVLKAILPVAGIAPEPYIAAATGFAHGLSGSGCCCGALLGAVMAIGLLCPEGSEGKKQCRQLTRAMHEAFVQRNRSTCCRVLIAKVGHGNDAQIEACATRTAEAAHMLAELLLASKA